MEALLSVEISVNILAVLVHVAALLLLLKTSQPNITGSQKYLFISLCLTELSYCLISLVHFWCKEYGVEKSIRKHITIFRRIAVLLMYYFIMIYITLDRFFAIYLNIKYRVYWSPEKTKRLIFFTSLVCIIASILVSVTWFQMQWSVTTFVYVYLYPPFMVVFIICAAITYSYIVIKIIANQQREDRLRKQVTRNNKNFSPEVQRKSKFTIFVPTIIILTFILFMVIPNFIHMTNKIILALPTYLVDINWILFPLGFISDAVVYIFSVNALRNICNKYLRKGNATTHSTSYTLTTV